MDDKIIISNRSALTAKYTPAGVAKIKASIGALIASDKTRGISTRYVYLDDAATMKRYGGKAVSVAADPSQNKAAVDAIFKSATPAYLMLLGAIDVIPHQDLSNPLYTKDGDDDKDAWGDLPYACDGAYSRDIANFRGPTRVVGRLPDLVGAKQPTHLLSLLATAGKYKARPSADYSAYFGLSTFAWRKSTALSLENVFGASSALKLSPPNGPSHPAGQLGALAHFVNCHGGDADPSYYGQKASYYPKSLTSKSVSGKIRPGTVAAVECCYGAQLYDSVTLALPLPICQQYLAQGAYGFFGSSTIAYGPASGNGSADLITQYFLSAVLTGASIGRATLMARQQFVQQVTELDPADLKTLAQFSLLGDPSITPVVATSATGVPKGMNIVDAERQERHERRVKAKALGDFLHDTKPTASRKTSGRRSPSVKKALANIAREAGIGSRREFMAYAVKQPPGSRAARGKSISAASRYFVAVYRPKADDMPIAAVAKEVKGRIVGYRIYEGKGCRAQMGVRNGSRGSRVE
jgi:hypothetical protein